MIEKMKRMCNMQMRKCCCREMMAMTMKGSVYIIIGNELKERKKYEKNRISNSNIIEYQHQQYLG